MYHLGDPCIHCGIPHDDVEPGICTNATGAAAVMRNIYYLASLLTEHEKEAAARSMQLRTQIAEQKTIVGRMEAGLDSDKIKLAETFLFVSDYSKGGEDKGGCRADAVKWFATGGKRVGDNPHYGDLRHQYMGTKNYDRWSGQRADNDYGCGPGHGSICFRIELKRDHRDREFSAEENEAAVYYLLNLERIQASKIAA